MTTSAPPLVRSASTPRPRRASYAHAHWYFVAALAVIVAGFWPSFFRPLTGGDAGRTMHGATATLWFVLLIAQSWLMSRGHVVWHRRVARSMVVLMTPVAASGPWQAFAAWYAALPFFR